LAFHHQQKGEAMTDQTEKPKRPVHEVRLRNVVAAIWANPGDDGRIYYAVTPYRIYNADDGWHRTTSFDRDDIPALTWVANKAFDYIAAIEAEPATRPQSPLSPAEEPATPRPSRRQAKAPAPA
jgi:hypothetical protein